jgi:hypothetical protein|nr:MAG TPA: hypothetical protein [Caudoviricetes sp.]
MSYLRKDALQEKAVKYLEAVDVLPREVRRKVSNYLGSDASDYVFDFVEKMKLELVSTKVGVVLASTGSTTPYESLFYPFLFSDELRVSVSREYEDKETLNKFLEKLGIQGYTRDTFVFEDLDSLVLYGSHEVLDFYQDKFSGKIAFYGPALSVAYVTSEDLKKPNVVEGLAEDVSVEGGTGCLNTKIIVSDASLQEFTPVAGSFKHPWKGEDTAIVRAITTGVEVSGRFPFFSSRQIFPLPGTSALVIPTLSVNEGFYHDFNPKWVSTLSISSEERLKDEVVLRILEKWKPTRICLIGESQEPTTNWAHDGAVEPFNFSIFRNAQLGAHL